MVQSVPLDPAEEIEDHSAIETVTRGALEVGTPARECWFWKNIDPALTEEDVQGLYIPRDITSRDSLKEYAEYLMDFTTSLSRKHGWLQHPSPRSHSWWSSEIAQAVHGYCLALQRSQDPNDLLSARHQWNSTICRAKAASFKIFIHHVAGERQDLWRMAR